MRSSPFCPRSDFSERSPSTQRKASVAFDLPEPFGPTMAVIGDSKSKSVFLAKDLKPESSRRRRRIGLFSPFFYEQADPRRFLLGALFRRANTFRHQFRTEIKTDG